MKKGARPFPASVLVAAGVILFGASFILLPSCLSSTSFLARSIRPSTAVTEIGGGAFSLPLSSGPFEVTGPLNVAFGGWAYQGFALGKNFEIGAFASMTGPSSISVGIPLKWQPFAGDVPVNWVIYGAPILGSMGGQGLGALPILFGTAITFFPAKGIEVFGLIDNAGDVHGSLGARFAVAPDWQLGIEAEAASIGPSLPPELGLAATLSWTPKLK